MTLPFSRAPRPIAVGSLLAVAFALLVATPACDDPPFRNPNDPSSPTYVPSPESGAVIVDDYNTGGSRNALGYCPETFTDASGVLTVTPSYVSQASEVLRGSGASLRLEFDVSGAGDPFGGYVEMLTGNTPCPSTRGLFNLEALNMRALTFWVRRPAADVDMEIALKSIDPDPRFQPANDNQTSPKRLLRTYVQPGTGWMKVRVPLSDLVPGIDGRPVDLKNLREVNFGFAKQRFIGVGAAVRGTLYIDEVAFER